MTEYFIKSFLNEIEKNAISIGSLAKTLGGVRGQIRAMGLPTVKSIMPMTKISPQGSPQYITSMSKRFSRRLPGKKTIPGLGAIPPIESFSDKQEALGTWKAIKTIPASLGIPKMKPESRKISGRLFLAHEKHEAQALKRGLKEPWSGHIHPSVLEREFALAKKLQPKYPEVYEALKRARGIEAKMPGAPESYKKIYKKWGVLPSYLPKLPKFPNREGGSMLPKLFNRKRKSFLPKLFNRKRESLPS